MNKKWTVAAGVVPTIVVLILILLRFRSDSAN